MEYNIEDGKTETIDMPNDYQRILSIDFSDNRQMVLSAVRAGYSDVFLFDTKMRQSKQITRDYHDDLNAVYAEINGSKGIIFSSNRIIFFCFNWSIWSGIFSILLSNESLELFSNNL